MFLKRTTTEILKDAAISIAQNTPITNFSAGSIARSIVEAIAPEIGTSQEAERVSLYDIAQDVLDQGFLSKATGEQLDLIGGLFSYPRRIEQVRGEDGALTEEAIGDEAYRYEISQIVPSMATANYSALRLALLTIPGVQDVIGKEYTHGTGSFSFLLIPQFGFDEDDVLAAMREKLQEAKAFGIRPHLLVPEKVPVDLTIQLIFHETTSDVEKQHIRFDVEQHVTSYLGSHEVGAGFTYHDLIQEVMNVSAKIVDFEITKFYMKNAPVLLTNHAILEEEQIIPQHITVI